MTFDCRGRWLLAAVLTAGLLVASMGGGAGCSSNSEDSTTPEAGSDASAEASACVGEQGPPPTCGGVVDSCVSRCEHYRDKYRSSVASAIVTACLHPLSTCPPSDADALVECVETAVGTACADTSAVTLCAALLAGCAGDGGDAGIEPFLQNDCVDLVTALNGAGRAEFRACVTEGTDGFCTEDPAGCFDLIQ